jgi:hypothetical protein
VIEKIDSFRRSSLGSSIGPPDAHNGSTGGSGSGSASGTTSPPPNGAEPKPSPPSGGRTAPLTSGKGEQESH